MNRIAEPILTIFTPAYNRAHTLPRTYESLYRQNCKDFIWLIVDDGSTDNTAELARDWQSRDNGFEIQYIYKENGGMHTAHNVAYANIHTELNWQMARWRISCASGPRSKIKGMRVSWALMPTLKEKLSAKISLLL